MAPMVHSVEIDRSPADVFAYVTDPGRVTEWQDSVVSARLEGEGPVQEGSRMVETRRVLGGREQTMTSEFTEYNPPSGFSFRVLDGPVRAFGAGRFEPLDDGSRTRYTLELDFEGHGIGKLLVPLVVRRQAEKEMERTHANLKQRLEASGS